MAARPPGDESSVIDLVERDTRPIEKLSRFDPIIVQELSRSILAALLGLTVLVTIVWAFTQVGKHSWGDTKELLNILFPAETALLGTAIAIYFAGRK